MSQIKATNVAEEEKPPKNAFEDFFECSGKSPPTNLSNTLTRIID